MTAVEWVKTVPLDCPHPEARELYVCYGCAAANLDAYARQRVEEFSKTAGCCDYCGHLTTCDQRVEAFRERANSAHIAFWLRVFAAWKARDFNTLKEFLDAEQENYAAAIRALEP